MKKIVLSSLIVIWIAFIFYNSLMPANVSSTQSMGVVRIITNLLTRIGLAIKEDVLSLWIRKLAHIFEYFILSLLLFTLFIEIFQPLLRGLVFGGLISLLIAAIDETIQTFVMGRYGSVVDVGIDMIGVVLSVIIILLFRRLINRRKEKKKA